MDEFEFKFISITLLAVASQKCTGMIVFLSQERNEIYVGQGVKIL